MRFLATLCLSAALALCLVSSSRAILPKPSNATSTRTLLTSYAAPAQFTGPFKKYYQTAEPTSVLPRPAIINAVSGGLFANKYFPDELANPTVLPTLPPTGDAVLPKPSATATPSASLADEIQANITNIISGSDTDCNKCIASLKLGQTLARADPASAPVVMQNLCRMYKYRSSPTVDAACNRTYAPETLGGINTQVLSYADFTSPNSTDAQYICSNVLGKCPRPAPRELTEDFLNSWFGGRRQPRAGLPNVAFKSGSPQLPIIGGILNALFPKTQRRPLRVLHFSDIHVDPRFLLGAEAACTNGQCCRADSFNATTSPNAVSLLGIGPTYPARLESNNISAPAEYWGNRKCDSPWPLVVAALESVNKINGGPVDMALYTGDMVTHDANWHLSRDLTYYTQQSLFDSMRYFFGPTTPVYAAIGNHDSSPSDAASPHSLPDGRGEQFSWDWDNNARLWQAEGWLNPLEARQAAAHYAGYSVSPRKGLRIITVNTDFWYKNNIFTNINTTNPDNSGMLRFLTDELQKAEDNQERVWIVGHVLTGWDGSNGLDNPTNLFYQIVDRFSPRTIAGIFFGHTHEDQFYVFYANNGTSKASGQAVANAFMGPSVTPGSSVNPSLRFYDVDPETYSVIDVHQYYTQLQDVQPVPGQGPTFQHLYSARAAYSNFTSSVAKGTYAAGVQLTGDGNATWPADAPLNATFWAALTDEMEARPELVQTFTVYQGRNSSHSPPCTSSDCVGAKICYMRSGSGPLGKQCLQGFGSVQG
ncbi:hypothetical protein A4X13_0g5615 [Tilletia indica]|uniref:Calcineurin-like phosphoesterase domain-containing protein n=1 Tax=Tilletia indica TaxID=43049 RepID=A0A177TEV6_9BASI|nr:hypothetical protein A4X13_0g5615 [Tilletia indica]